MCAVVKGYPLVIRNSDSPEKQWGIPFDAPLFYWYREEDKERQLITYMEQTFSIQPSETKKAVLAGNDAMRQFGSRLKEAGAKVLEEVEKEGRYAVVLASRPYQNDALVNHSLPELLTEFGVPVLTADSVPGIENVDLSHSRLDVVNNYHARMLASAVLAAQSQNLEYVQFVSFGCGHDAYLSDEIQRMMREISGKSPLILKLDESDTQGTKELVQAIGAKLTELPPILQYEPEPLTAEELAETTEKGTFEIEVEDGVYYIDAKFLEPILRTVNLDDYSSLQYFQKVLRSSGIIDKLEEMGIQEGDTVNLYGFEFDFVS